MFMKRPSVTYCSCGMKFILYSLLWLALLGNYCVAQFHIDTLAQSSAISFPVAITFPKDNSNRLFFTEKATGRVRIIRNDSLLPDPFLTVQVSSYGEQGLLGIAFHPHYPDSPFVYIYYTRTGDSANVVARYTDSSGVGVNPHLLMTIPRIVSSPSHNGGNLHFGPDGKLYVSVGDYFISNYAQDTSNTNKRGKIHRLNPDGSVPADNPYPGNSLFVYGCRNSFDFTWDAFTGKMYSTENGPNCNDEINNIVAGGNYGWPIEGNCTYYGTPRFKSPMFYWSKTISPTGIIVYRDSVFPQLYGKMLVANFNLGTLLEFGLNGTGDSVTGPPQTGIMIGSGLIDVETGPDGNIYLANSNFQGISRILRLRPAIISPAIPQLQFPPDNTPHQNILFSFKWNQSPETEHYRLQVSLDSNFTSIVFDTLTHVDITVFAAHLSYTTQYYWRVNAQNNLGTSDFSSVRTFTTAIPPPPAPLLASPDSGSQNMPTSFTVLWHPAETAESYSLQVANNIGFVSPIISAENIIDTTKAISQLANATTYYWRVNASNIGGTSSYSLTRSFKTIVALPTAVSLTSPLNQSINQPIHTVFQWHSVSTATSYQLQVSSNTGFTDIVYQDSLIIATTSSGGSYSFGTKYFWRVRAINLAGEGAWSPIWSYTTELQHFTVSESWNMISLPLDVSGKTHTTLFPTASSLLFGYKTGQGFHIYDTLVQGKGYWIRFDSSQTVSYPGKIVLEDTLDLNEGWNLIGSISDTVATDSVMTIPPHILGSSFIGYDKEYYTSEKFEPGKAYWIRVTAEGKLIFSATTQQRISTQFHGK